MEEKSFTIVDDTKSKKKDNSFILQNIENTLTEYKYNVPMNNYLTLAKEYKNICISFNKLLSKEKDRNRKFVAAKKKLVETYNNEITNMKHEIDDYKRVVAKYKENSNNRKNKKDNSTKRSSEDNFKSIREAIDHVITEFFSGQKIELILNNVVKDLTSSHNSFDFQKINLTFFDAHKIAVLQNSMYKIVMNTIETNSKAVISAIANTILRNQYRYIHQRFAKKVLEASNVSRGVFKFFGEVFVEQEDGKRWSSFAITRFMGDYLHQIDILRKIDRELSALKDKNSSIGVLTDKLELESDEKYRYQAQERKKIDRQIHQNTLRLSEEQLKFSDMKIQYDELLEATTNTLLEKRRVFKVDEN